MKMMENKTKWWALFFFNIVAVILVLMISSNLKNDVWRQTSSAVITTLPIRSKTIENKTISKQHVEQMELVKVKDNGRDSDVNKISIETRSVVYDVDVLHKELLKTHFELYDNKTGEKCVLRDPKCVILGVAKSGTQELVDFSSLHPNIVLKPALAPPEMFHSDKSKRMQVMAREKKHPMPCSYSDQIAVAKTDDYLFRPEMPQTLHTFNPDLKLVLIVREPIARMISGFSFHYLQQIQRKERFVYKPQDVPAMDNVFVNESDGQVKMNRELDLSMYHIGLERYLKIFPLEQIMIIETNEFKNDPVGVLKRFETFLNLKSVFGNNFLTFVKDKGFYCLNKDKVYCYGSDRGRVVMRELRAETRATLKSFFKPHNEKFFDLIGRRFNW